jgi:riboflavin transporter FmnP
VVLGGFLNLYVLIPTFGKALHLPMDEFVKMGSKIFPVVNSLKMLVLVCVIPFNALKVFLTSLVTGLIYKHISPILKNTK